MLNNRRSLKKPSIDCLVQANNIIEILQDAIDAIDVFIDEHSESDSDEESSESDNEESSESDNEESSESDNEESYEKTETKENKDDHPDSERNGNETSHAGGHHGDPNRRFPIITVDFERIATEFVFSLWILLACLAKIAFHMTPKLPHVVPESCMLILLGLIIGIILVYANPEKLESPLTVEGFFIFLLPPIMLDAGYFMPNRLFFDHLGSILVFAVFGTVWNALTIGPSLYGIAQTGLFGSEEYPILHVFLFSSLISAVDPVAVIAVFEEIHVDEVLFILVFGESLLNDGVTVVLYHIFEGFNEIGAEYVQFVDVVYGLISFILVACGGSLIGIIWGFIAAFITRFTYNVRVIEPIFIFVIGYIAYLNAELLHWSGILSITFCGITMKNYTEQNMSQKSQTTTKIAMKMMASTAETVIFLFLGVATVLSRNHINVWFIVFTILFCCIYRALGTIILSEIMNIFRVQKIDFVQKFMLSYGGIRGAVCFALAITINPEHIPLAPTFVTATISMVYFTMFLQGITVKPLVAYLGVKLSNKTKMNMNERLHNRTMDYVMAGIEDLAGQVRSYKIRTWFKRINDNYLNPFFVPSVKLKEPKLFETLTNLHMQDALNYMNQKPNLSTNVGPGNVESVSSILHSNVYSKNGEWNLDVGEMEYEPGDRDLNEARFHHFLSDNFNPSNAGRRKSIYNRHAIREDELEDTDFQNKMFLRARQVAMQSVKYRKAVRKSPGNLKILEVDRPAQQNGSAIRLKSDYIHETTGIDNPTFEDNDGLVEPKKQTDFISNLRRFSIIGPSIAETILPWKRFGHQANPVVPHVKERRSSLPHIGGKEPHHTMAEMQLPWKRNNDPETDEFPLKQSEFPGWASNKDYSGCYSPTNTLLGKITGINETRPSMRDIFDRRQSSARDNENFRRGSAIDGEGSAPSLRNSAKDPVYSRRGSLIDDPLRRRGSHIDDPTFVKGMLNELRVPHGFPKDNMNESHQMRRGSSHDVLGFDSLLNTVIEEEQPPKVKSGDHVIFLNPDGESTTDTSL